MPRQLALFICILFILWLFVRDRNLRPMTSLALWIPLLWITIIGSRPITSWFGGGIDLDSPDAYLDGSPLDRDIFLVLIILGLMVLLKRRVNWKGFFAVNRWLLVFIIYCGISVIWSDYPFVGFKRWIKDIGNVIMVMVILTEKDHVSAMKAVFARYTYIAIPLSIVFIKYFPEIGRYYNRWTWEPSFGGVTLEKNTLGAIAFICGLFIVWDLIQMRSVVGRRVDFGARIALLLMVFWLINMAHSSTSLVCLFLGTSVLLFIRLPLARRHVRHLGIYSLVIGVIIFIVYSVPGILETFVDLVGRDMTFTGRTDLWSDLMKVHINPLIGTGYQSFWLGSRAEHMWKLYSFHPNQAHNGFLETYLNGGYIGVFLIMALIVSTGRKLKRELLLANNYGILQFSFLVVVLFSNWTEATFNKQTLVWIIMIIATLTHPGSPNSLPQNVERSANSDPNKAAPKWQPQMRANPRHFKISD